MSWSAWQRVEGEGLAFAEIVYEKKHHAELEGGVARITMAKPEKYNAMTLETVNEMFRVTRPGGSLIVNVAAMECLRGAAGHKDPGAFGLALRVVLGSGRGRFRSPAAGCGWFAEVPRMAWMSSRRGNLSPMAARFGPTVS